jgi:hypothetical protein
MIRSPLLRALAEHAARRARHCRGARLIAASAAEVDRVGEILAS